MGSYLASRDTRRDKCQAGKIFCRDCFQEMTPCFESDCAKQYWDKWAGNEPDYWKDAATRILNSHRPQKSPKYAPCSDNWAGVLRESYCQYYQIPCPLPVLPSLDPAEYGPSTGKLQPIRPNEFWSWVELNEPKMLLRPPPKRVKLEDLAGGCDPWGDDYDPWQEATSEADDTWYGWDDNSSAGTGRSLHF